MPCKQFLALRWTWLAVGCSAEHSLGRVGLQDGDGDSDLKLCPLFLSEGLIPLPLCLHFALSCCYFLLPNISPFPPFSLWAHIRLCI